MSIIKSIRPTNKTMRLSMLEQKIVEELNNYFYAKPDYEAELEMLQYQYDHEQHERYGLHASEIAGGSKSKGFCMRQHVLSLFFHRDDETRQYPPNLMRIFEEGKSIGTKWQRLFIRAGAGVKENMDVLREDDDTELIYTPDAIITIDGHEYVVEIKSMNNNTYHKSDKHPKGAKQLKVYLHFTGIKRGFVLMENKDTQAFKVQVIELEDDDKDIAELLYTLDDIQHHKRLTIKHKKPPERHEGCVHPESTKAKNCPMRGACWGIDRRKIKR